MIQVYILRKPFLDDAIEKGERKEKNKRSDTEKSVPHRHNNKRTFLKVARKLILREYQIEV